MEMQSYKAPKSSIIMRFLWSAAGADKVILEKSTYSDQVKYMCLGGIIVATGVMAALAGGYAFYTIFSPRGSAIESESSLIASVLSIIFGILWGLMIFNLDRFIVSSTGKGDGTEAITWQEFKGAIPRIIMGAIIALTISKPIEIRMFKSEIDAALYEEQLVKQKDFEVRTRKNFADRIKDLEKENESIEDRISDYHKKISVKDSLYNVETSSGQGGRGEGEGPVAMALKNERDRLKQELDVYISNNKLKIDNIESRRKKLYDELDLALKQNKVVSNGLDGLLERIILAHRIAGWQISLFITLLFMAIELTPIFFKLMLVKSPYDFMKDNIEEKIKAENGIFVEYNYHKDKKGQERDLVVFLDSEKLVLEKREIQKAQKELTEYAISKYKEDMKKKIDENPSAFIKVQDNK
jgi:hypothetical protein